ncbi:MAG: pyridoxamine 5'-phosphate oxidase family protein [Mojavia pulchra JT2-VF2]|jgi:nitroimidazol reductase NimA-like FMN-containing flavoprotein (pyridoxamine 5'-phosphate oxidase superfamily)|uniref:Pyridoxamine 5'-phosphate oxidase family protein n=1 Tax=Mojavia pulchra JT2-VF2 TaxID=287848 RepID=A0A951UF17_9NOST|nr:pyridoxamine 5'-phosphate oxidase family protein [Mojavia pulchra JT2-VF2]
METANATNGWVNTIDCQNPEVIAKASRIITNNIYCTLSTCSADGYPWASPVFFAYDDNCNIYWSSAIVSKHSQNLDNNHGRVAIAIYNSSFSEGSVEGLYFCGTASELKPEETERVLKLLINRATKKHNRTAADYLNDSPRRIYQCQPQEAWVTGDRVAVANQLVDTKIQINLADLQNSILIEQ